MTVDRAEVFRLLTLRQQLRREAGLKPLNMMKEYRHEIALAEQNDFRDYAAQHEPERLMIREQVVADLREQRGADFGYTPGGISVINMETNKRFREHLWNEYQLGEPPEVVRHPIVYGGGNTDIVKVVLDDGETILSTPDHKS